MLRNEGIEESPFERLREGKPDEIRAILSWPLNEWRAEDRDQVYNYFRTTEMV